MIIFKKTETHVSLNTNGFQPAFFFRKHTSSTVFPKGLLVGFSFPPFCHLFGGMLRLTVPTGFTVATAFDACEARVAYHHGTPPQPKTISFALRLEGEPTPKMYLCCIGIMENFEVV